MRTVILLVMVLGLTSLTLASRRKSHRFDSEADDSEDTDSCCEGLLVAFRDYGCYDNPNTYICHKLARQLAEESAEDFTSKCNPCVLRPCQNGGTCTWTSSTSYTCHCPPGFTGANCGVLTPCQPDPCQNGGTCTPDSSSYTCTCPPEYRGTDCDVDVCLFQTCLNGGTCSLVTGTQNFTCDCPEGFTGTRCEMEVPPVSEFCLEGNYQLLDEPWRHPDNSYVGSPNLDEDFIVDDAWYRFKINGVNAMIPPGCFGVGFCGTDFPIKFYPWGVEPEEGEAVEAQVCDRGSSPTLCCDDPYTITVRRCSGFTVYKLKNPSYGAYYVIQEQV